MAFDVLISTPIFTRDGDGGSGFAAAVATSSMSGFDVDPSVDPKLALALRVSMEEDAAKQEKDGEKTSSSHDVTMAGPLSDSTHQISEKRNDLTDDETALLQQALAMSMDDNRFSVLAMGDANMSDTTSDD